MSQLQDQSGSVLAEYALVLALLSLVFMAGMTAVDTATSNTLTSAQGALLNYGLNGS
jgi:Flp pilus assembly pilin Flp